MQKQREMEMEEKGDGRKVKVNQEAESAMGEKGEKGEGVEAFGRGRIARHVAHFNSGGLGETSILRFPAREAAGDWSYLPGRGWGVL